jgi:hypothetical protein
MFTMLIMFCWKHFNTNGNPSCEQKWIWDTIWESVITTEPRRGIIGPRGREHKDFRYLNKGWKFVYPPIDLHWLGLKITSDNGDRGWGCVCIFRSIYKPNSCVLMWEVALHSWRMRYIHNWIFGYRVRDDYTTV